MAEEEEEVTSCSPNRCLLHHFLQHFNYYFFFFVGQLAINDEIVCDVFKGLLFLDIEGITAFSKVSQLNRPH